jgi:hypothetical protein
LKKLGSYGVSIIKLLQIMMATEIMMATAAMAMAIMIMMLLL